MKHRHDLHVCIDIAIKNIDWITMSIASDLRNTLISLIQETFQSSIDPTDEISIFSVEQIKLLHKAHHMDEVIQYCYSIDDAIYQIDNPYIKERLFLGIGLYVLQDHEDASFGFANAKFARMSDPDAQKLHTHLGIYDAKKRFSLLSKHHYEHILRIAIAKDDITFALQPKIPLQKELPFAAEALLRCPPLSESISCFDIIQLAESNGMICDLDRIIFAKVCAYQKQRLLQKETLFPISVNLSRMHFQDACFFQEFYAIFQTYNIPTTCISFELTESAITPSLPSLYTILSDIKSYGFTCAIDDFGCGASSFISFQELPFDTIKLDRQFFLQEEQRSTIILESIVKMAKQLDIQVVAEGVETMKQVQLLKSWGCDYIQAYLFGKAMTPLELQHFYQGWLVKKHSLFL